MSIQDTGEGHSSAWMPSIHGHMQHYQMMGESILRNNWGHGLGLGAAACSRRANITLLKVPHVFPSVLWFAEKGPAVSHTICNNDYRANKVVMTSFLHQLGHYWPLAQNLPSRHGPFASATHYLTL